MLYTNTINNQNVPYSHHFSRSSSSPQGLHLGRHGNLVAGNVAARVDLARLPVRVLLRLVFTVEIQVDAALGPEHAALVSAGPGLVNVEPVGWAAKVERAHVGVLAVEGAVVIDHAVVKVLQPERPRLADQRVFDGCVLERKVDAAHGVLVGWVGEDVRRVKVKVLDGPFRDLGGLARAGSFLRGRWEGCSSAGEESGGE